MHRRRERETERQAIESGLNQIDLICQSNR